MNNADLPGNFLNKGLVHSFCIGGRAYINGVPQGLQGTAEQPDLFSPGKGDILPVVPPLQAGIRNKACKDKDIHDNWVQRLTLCSNLKLQYKPLNFEL